MASTPDPDFLDATDRADDAVVSTDEWELTHGERLSKTLDLSTWEAGPDLPALYERLSHEVADSVRQEAGVLSYIRSEFFPTLDAQPNAPACAGVFPVSPELIA